MAWWIRDARNNRICACGLYMNAFNLSVERPINVDKTFYFNVQYAIHGWFQDIRVCRWAKLSHLQHIVYEAGSQVGNM